MADFDLTKEQYVPFHKTMPLVCVDVVIRTGQGKFLLVKRNNEPAKNQWWLVGGRVRKKESLEEAARRKVKEEIGINVNALKKIVSGYETIFPEDPFGHGQGTHSINICYRAEISDEELKQIKVDPLHSGCQLFSFVDDSWHPYLQECLREAGFSFKPDHKFIPVCEPTLRGRELEYATEAIKSGWISSAGKFIGEFENKFAAYCGVKYGISCSSGTSALHMAIKALGIGKGDEVIVPTFSMAASSNAVVYAGATPVFVDSELETWNMDIAQVEKKITGKTRAIMVVHTYGHPMDMDRLRAIADRFGLPIIEDAAEAHGAEYKGKKAGSLGDIACFSYYANKIINCGEGGMVITDNYEWAERCKKLRNHFFGEPRFWHQEVGFNYRLTNVQAAIGLAQMEKIEEYVEARRRNARLYNQLLKDVPGLITPPEKEWAKNVYWMYGLLVGDEFGLSMPKLREKLKEKGIDTRTFFICLHKQPMYHIDGSYVHDKDGEYPNAEVLEKRGFYLPSSSHLTEEEIGYIAETIKEIQREAKGRREETVEKNGS